MAPHPASTAPETGASPSRSDYDLWQLQHAEFADRPAGPPNPPQPQGSPALHWVDAAPSRPSPDRGSNQVRARGGSQSRNARPSSSPAAAGQQAPMTRAHQSEAKEWMQYHSLLKKKETACSQDLAISVASNVSLQKHQPEVKEDNKRSAADHERLRDKLAKKHTNIKEKVSHVTYFPCSPACTTSKERKGL